MALLDFFRWRRVQPPDRVIVTDEEVIRIRPDGVQEQIRWDALSEVGILTTDEGPWCEDVFWLLLGPGGATGCAVPQGAAGSDQLLTRLQTLPGFDNEAVLAAMGSTSNARFTCWQRPV